MVPPPSVGSALPSVSVDEPTLSVPLVVPDSEGSSLADSEVADEDAPGVVDRSDSDVVAGPPSGRYSCSSVTASRAGMPGIAPW